MSPRIPQTSLPAGQLSLDAAEFADWCRGHDPDPSTWSGSEAAEYRRHHEDWMAHAAEFMAGAQAPLGGAA